jgi:hypothetical protein
MSRCRPAATAASIAQQSAGASDTLQTKAFNNIRHFSVGKTARIKCCLEQLMSARRPPATAARIAQPSVGASDTLQMEALGMTEHT